MMKSSLGNMIIRLSKKVLAAALAGMVLATAMPGMSVDAKTSNSTNSAANEAAVPGASSAISESARAESVISASKSLHNLLRSS